MSESVRRSKAPFTLAERNAVIEALRTHPELSDRDLANRLRCSHVTIWKYRQEPPALLDAPLEAIPVFDTFDCACGAPVVVGPISARGPRLCSMCRAARCQS